MLDLESQILGLCKQRGDLALIFALEHPSYCVDATWALSLEVPKAQMVSLQVLVDWQRNADIQKQRCKPGLSTQRDNLEKFPSLVWILGCWVTWIHRGIFRDRGKEA